MISPDICISLGRRAPPGEFSTPKAPSQCDGGPSLYHFSFLIVSSEYHCEPRSIVMAVQPLIILWYRQYFIMVPSKFNQTPVRLSWYTVLMHSDFRKYFWRPCQSNFTQVVFLAKTFIEKSEIGTNCAELFSEELHLIQKYIFAQRIFVFIGAFLGFAWLFAVHVTFWSAAIRNHAAIAER